MARSFTLPTERLVMRPFVEADLDDLRRFHRDPAVQTGYDPEGKPWSDEAIAQRLGAYIEEHERQGFSRWRLSLKTGEFIGRAGLGWHVEGESVELGYGLLPQYRGLGYAHEASAALIRWGFDNLPISRIIAFTYPDNEPSAKVLKALGVGYVDDRPRSVRDGVCSYYEITRGQAAARAT